MSALQAFLDGLAQALRDRLGAPPPSIGIIAPLVITDAPAVVLSVTEVEYDEVAGGGRPQERRGVMPLELRLDLATGSIQLDGETVTLVEADRRSVHLPQAPLVDHDGGAALFLDASDAAVSVAGAAQFLVAGPPGPGQARLVAESGLVEFGTPLPASGELLVTYRIGAWEETCTRCHGLVQVEVCADAAAIFALTEAVTGALDGPADRLLAGLARFTPHAWEPIVGWPGLAALRHRRLVYRFTYDHRSAVVPGGGGPIRRIQVANSGDLGFTLIRPSTTLPSP